MFNFEGTVLLLKSFLLHWNLLINLPNAVRKAELICCGPSFCLKSTKQILMTWEERGGIVGIYSSGVKTTLKVRIAPMETTTQQVRNELSKLPICMETKKRIHTYRPDYIRNLGKTARSFYWA